MKEMVCIVCPNSCSLTVKEENGIITVSGNKCKRGETFAINELKDPKRTISSTVKTIFKDAPVAPVKVSGEIPKNRIFDVMKEINKVVLDKREQRGYKVIENCLNLGIDIVITSDILLSE